MQEQYSPREDRGLVELLGRALIDPEFRKKYDDHSTEVTVGPSETQSAKLRVVSADEMK